MRLRNGIQQFLGEINQSGCYALCLIDVAAEYNCKIIDVVQSIYDGCDKGYIYFNPDNLDDNNNMYVKNPAKFLEMLTGVKWCDPKKITINPAEYTPGPGEYIIQYYERVKTGAVVGHFERDYFKPIRNSLTVKYGKLHSLRVLKVA